MSERKDEEKVTDTGGGPAPEGVGVEPPGGTDSASAASIGAPQAHPGLDVEVAPDEEGPELFEDERPLPDDEVLRPLVELDESLSWHLSHGQDVIVVPPEHLSTVAKKAKETGFEMCVDVTAVDWFRKRRERFDVVINLLSHQHVKRLRLIVPVGGDEPAVPSVTPLWPGANFAEREVYDMYGIRFEGHPDLTRILMPDDWQGHPLRKDFGVGSVPVQFKEAHEVR